MTRFCLYGGLSVGIAALSAWNHRHLPDIGFYLTNSDYAVFELLGQDFASSFSNWTVFPYQQDYGGSLFTIFRAFWLKIRELCLGQAIYSSFGAYQFSYQVTPAFLAVISFLLARAYASLSTAIMVGTLAAFGFHFWSGLFGNDFYFAAFGLGSLLLIWRGRYGNPIQEMKWPWLCFSGVVCGMGLTVFRAFLIYVVAFLVPSGFVKDVWRQLLLPHDRIEKALILVIGLLVFLFIYLQLFGGDLGLLAGKNVRLHAAPNILYAGVFGLIFVVKKYRVSINRKLLGRIGCFLSGAFLGLLPELIFQMWNSGRIYATSWERIAYFPEIVNAAALDLPRAFRELAMGHDFQAYPGIERNFPLLLMTLSVLSVFLSRSVRFSKIEPVRNMLILGLVAFLSIKTYTMGATRYLFPVFPALIIGIALLLEDSARKGRFVWSVIVVIMIGTATYQIQARDQLMTRAQLGLATSSANQMRRVIELFRAQGVDVVVTDSYWHSNQYTVLSERKPFFISIGRKWGPEAGFERVKTDLRVGVLITDKGSELGAGGTIQQFLGTKWKLFQVEQIGEFLSLVGEKVLD